MPTSGSEGEQHQIADIQSSDEAPEQIAVIGDELRSGWHAVNHQRADQHGGDRSGRNAERQHRHEGAGGRGIVGRFRPATPATAPLPNCSGCLETAFQRVGQKLEMNVRGARNDADDETEHAAARDRQPASRHSWRVGSNSRSFGAITLPRTCARRRQDLAQAEQADRHRHDADAVAQLGESKLYSGSARSYCRCDHRRSSPTQAISSVRTSEVDDM